MGFYDSVEDQGLAVNQSGKWMTRTANYTGTKIGKFHEGHVDPSDELACPYCRRRVSPSPTQEERLADWEKVVNWIRDGAGVEVVEWGHGWLRIRISSGPAWRTPEENRVFQFLRFGQKAG